eukprot:174946-Amphidinium_carterae.1
MSDEGHLLLLKILKKATTDCTDNRAQRRPFENGRGNRGLAQVLLKSRALLCIPILFCGQLPYLSTVTLLPRYTLCRVINAAHLDSTEELSSSDALG